jgi:HPt (histidine-containing phosphotransfer) domain-containing protein
VEDIKRKFLPRFATLAKERIRVGLEVAAGVEGDQALVLARELHSMAGEAGLLGLGDLLSLARAAEVAATQLHAARVPSKRTALQQALLDLHLAVVTVERQLELAGAQPSTPSPSGPSKAER